MNIFVYEHLTATACQESAIDDTLLDEGRAMAEAILSDLSSLPEADVSILWGSAILPPEVLNVFVESVQSESQLDQQFEQQCRNADRILIIAPESDGILQETLEKAQACHTDAVLNSSGTSLNLGCDKWRLAQFCTQHDIPHFPTQLVDGSPLIETPVILKPRDGAGCDGIQLVHSAVEAKTIPTDDRFIMQPLMEGVSLSSAACYSASGERLLTLPLGKQLVDFNKNVITYQGGSIPWQHDDFSQATEQADDILKTLESQLDGLRGYVGIDWLWESETNTLRLVEINPRLTTAYVGYRNSYGSQIAHTLIYDSPCRNLPEMSHIEFRAHSVPAQESTS